MERRKTAYVNGAIIAANILIFLYMELIGSTEDTAFMIRNGAMYAPLVVEHGQYYRLITSVFLHFGIEHLLNNMLVLFVLGDNLERALGHIKYLIFYLLCGAGANVVSLLFHLNPRGYFAAAAGASGAIFGVVGGLAYAVAANRGRLEDLSTRQLTMMIIFSLYFGFTGTGIDNAAHVGGLFIGIFLGKLFYRKPKRRNPEEMI